MSDEISKMSNQAFLDHVDSDDPGMVKTAQDGVNDYTRKKMREEGFLRQILPPIPLSADELDRSVDTDKPIKIVDVEPDNPGSVTVPFATNPVNRYIQAPRYRVMFARIQTPQFAKDKEELATYHMDIRQVISDNAIKDMLAEEDESWIAAVNDVLVGPNKTVPETNSVQWEVYSDKISRKALAESLKVMPKTPSRLEPATALLNNITIKDVLKFERPEAGGDVSQDLFLNGFAQQKIMGVTWAITIKRDIVPTDTIFYFAEPQFLGKFYTREDATMYLDKRAWMIQFFAYECIGAGIGNIGGVCRVDFNDSSLGSAI